MFTDQMVTSGGDSVLEGIVGMSERIMQMHARALGRLGNASVGGLHVWHLYRYLFQCVVDDWLCSLSVFDIIFSTC